jgi:hypothetical protein
MPAGVEEDVDLPLLIADEDYRLAAHPRDEIVAGIGDLAFMTDEQPSAGEELFELVGMNGVADEDFAADDPALGIDKAIGRHGVSTLDSGPDWAVVRLDKVFYFVDSHHVGSFEGILRFAGVKGTVRIASRGSASADLLLAWDASP